MNEHPTRSTDLTKEKANEACKRPWHSQSIYNVGVFPAKLCESVNPDTTPGPRSKSSTGDILLTTLWRMLHLSDLAY